MAGGWFGSEICGLPVENERKGEEEMYTYNLTQWLAFFIIYCFIDCSAKYFAISAASLAVT